MAPTPPCPTARSVSSKIRFLSSALNLRRSGLTGTSGSGELVTKGTAILVSLTMILLAALLCNYGRGKCLIIIGTEGRRQIENYLMLPAAIVRAASVKGMTCTEDDVIAFLRDEHSVFINQTFTSSECSQAIADLYGKELTYAAPKNAETRFGVTRFEIARAMRAEEICDDVKTLLHQIQELCTLSKV